MGRIRGESQKWDLCSQKCWKNSHLKEKRGKGRGRNIIRRKSARKGMQQKGWKGGKQSWKKKPAIGRQGNGSQRNMCWSRYKNWNKKNVRSKQNEKRKGGENKTQKRNRRIGKGRQHRAQNCGCKHHQKWSTRNKRKVKKTNTKEGKKERWQNKSK